MRKMICSGLMATALVVLSAVPVLANDDEEVLLDSEDTSSTEYTGVREMSLGARLFPYAPLRGGMDFLWRPKWGICAAQIENINYTAEVNGQPIHCTGAELHFGGGIWSNMEKTNWWGYHIYFSMVWPLTWVRNVQGSTRFAFGNGKSLGLGLDFYPRIWRGGTIVRGDKFVSYFADVQAASRLLIVDWGGQHSDRFSSSMFKNITFQVGARYWF